MSLLLQRKLKNLERKQRSFRIAFPSSVQIAQGNSRSSSRKERQSPTSPPPTSCLLLISTDHHPDNVAPSPLISPRDMIMMLISKVNLLQEIPKWLNQPECGDLQILSIVNMCHGTGPTSQCEQPYIIFVDLSYSQDISGIYGTCLRLRVHNHHLVASYLVLGLFTAARSSINR